MEFLASNVTSRSADACAHAILEDIVKRTELLTHFHTAHTVTVLELFLTKEKNTVHLNAIVLHDFAPVHKYNCDRVINKVLCSSGRRILVTM